MKIPKFVEPTIGLEPMTCRLRKDPTLGIAGVHKFEHSFEKTTFAILASAPNVPVSVDGKPVAQDFILGCRVCNVD